MNIPLPHKLAAGGIFLKEQYDVFLDGKCVGGVKVTKSGLYYLLSCRCCLPKRGPYKIVLSSGEKEYDLGLCVPVDGALGMNTRITSKNISSGDWKFRAAPRNNEVFVPIETGSVFPYIYALRRARFAVENTVAGLRLQEDPS